MTDSPEQSDDLVEFVRVAFPSAEDKLFTSQEDWWTNACLNWCNDGWGLYATGYKEAADLLVQHVIDSGKSQDILVYPIVFLYRQYLELAIKDLIREGRLLQDIDAPFPVHHKLNELWKICQNLLNEISPGDSVGELGQITRLLDEFSAADPTSMAFRYPADNKGNPSLPGVTTINLRVVGEVVEKITNLLGGAAAQIGEYLSIKNDIESEFRCDSW